VLDADEGARYIGEFSIGEVWFDDVLTRKDGVFVLPELEGLNPDRLGG